MTTAADWAGRVGDVWAREWQRTDRSFSDLAPWLDAAVLAAAPAGPFTALDIGSGAGATALALARARPDSRVTGVDLSADLVAVARERAGDLSNAQFQVGDAVTAAAAIRPDLIVSRHGVMFFDDPAAAFSALHRAAANGARLVFSCFAAPTDNAWATLATPAPAGTGQYAPGPFAFADSEQTTALLASAGWRGEPHHIQFAYRVGAGTDPVGEAMTLLTRIGPAAALLRDAPPDGRPRLLAALHDRLERQRSGDVIDFPAAAWLWTGHAL